MLKKIILLILILSFWYTQAAYYEPNPSIQSYLNDVTNNFVKIVSYSQAGQNVPTSLFASVANDFSVLKTKLPQEDPSFKVIYEKCEITANALANWYTRELLNTFNAQCFWPWKRASRTIFSKYKVIAWLKAYPSSWNAPLTVTFDARSSRDPSNRTIPINNYYWYYTNSAGQKIFMWQWPLIKYTFETPNSYVVHLTVRSVNKKSQWILDWSASTVITVNPPIAKINLYVNWIRANINSYVKLSSEEGKKWVLFDASWTTPTWDTKIVSSTWEVKRRWRIIYKNTIPDYPGAIRIKLPENGFYFIKIIVVDNTGKEISKTYKVIVSNPVALVRVYPKIGDTSTKFKIDGWRSYSVNWKIKTYKWTIVWPNWNRIFTSEWETSFSYKFNLPGIYSIKLEIEDVNWNKNSDTYKLLVSSTPPVANFIYKTYDNWAKPSTFIFDASYSYDVDTKYGDKLSYIWNISNKKYVKTQLINWWEKMIAQFNKKWVYNITLTVKDKYWKYNSITKKIVVKSTLRPKISINPNYTILWNPIWIRISTNKPVAYYEYYYGDWEISKTQSDFMEHTYKKVWVFTLKVKAFSIDWGSNSITKNVFVGQRWYPLAIYKIYKWNNQQLPSTYCKVKKQNSTWFTFVKAYKIPRQQLFTIDASDSVNWQWNKSLLDIYFQKANSSEYISKSVLWLKFDELGCTKIKLNVKDLSTNKLDTKSIYFKVVDAPPVIKWISMFFPQYWWQQWWWSFKPNIWHSNVPKNLFTKWFDPLLVKLEAKWVYDPDSPFIDYYKWYYYRKWDRANLINVKITPYNIAQIVFALPKIPGTYIFWVDVCDVNWKCTNSEKYLHAEPTVNIPPSDSNPNYPQVNSVRVDYNWIKWVWEVNIWDKVNIHVNTTILSSNPDFQASRTIEYDFNDDWKYDLITKKTNVTHIYKKPCVDAFWHVERCKVKVKVIYRWYAWIWFSSPFIVKQWLRPLVDLNVKWKNLIFNDMSLWNIYKKKLCFDIRNCIRHKRDYLFTQKKYWYVHYSTTWQKLLLFEFKDKYWNKKLLKKRLDIKNDISWSLLLTLPKAVKHWNNYNITVAWMYKNSIIFYYKSKNKNCYIDKNISVDTNGDGNTTDDKDLICNKIYKLTYNLGLPNVWLLIHDGKKLKKVNVVFSNIQVSLPNRYKKDYEILQWLIYKYSWNSSSKIIYLVKLLSDLSNNLTDKSDRASILLELHDIVNKWIAGLNSNDITKIKSVINSLSNAAINAAFSDGNTTVSDSISSIEMYFGDNNNQINTLLDSLKNTTNRVKRKEILQKVMNLWLKYHKNGTIDDETLQLMKGDICTLLQYYEIPSKACWTWLKSNDVKIASTWINILKIVGIFLLVIFVIFIIIIVVFVIKAKKAREENEEDEEDDKNDS